MKQEMGRIALPGGGEKVVYSPYSPPIPEEQKIVFPDKKEMKIELWIGKNTARINGKAVPIDPEDEGIAPVLIKGNKHTRAMWPGRFVSESMGFRVDWDQDEQKVTITG